jgi:hypothetical protein
MTEKLSTATGQVFTHVKRAVSALDRFAGEGTTRDGVPRSHNAQRASLKIAAEEIRKALAVLDRTKWR